VAEIGEAVVGTTVRAFVACHGPPLSERIVTTRRCLYYRDRESRTYWQFCARGGRIISGLGNLPRPAPR
jgi:hypothetical protein